VIPAGSSSESPAIRPGPTTAARAATDAIRRLLRAGASVLVWVTSAADLALPRPASVVFPGEDVDDVVGEDAADGGPFIVEDQQT